MQIVAIQFDIVWEDPSANLAKVAAMLQTRQIEPGSLIALPEMFATGFTMNIPAAVRGCEQTMERLAAIAQEYASFIVAGVAVPASPTPSPSTLGEGRGEGRTVKSRGPAESGGPSPSPSPRVLGEGSGLLPRDGDIASLAHNRAVVFGPDGQLVASYTKLHPFTLGGEKAHFEAGREINTFACGGFTVAPFVCYDLRFPEIFRHAAARLGANFFTVIASWPISRVEHWITLLRARAIENQSYVLGVNRIGRDPATLYPGRSILVDPMGVVRADAADTETLLTADADPEFVRQIRSKLPFLQDLRDDLAL